MGIETSHDVTHKKRESKSKMYANNRFKASVCCAEIWGCVLTRADTTGNVQFTIRTGNK